ncbi:hypothetical protein A9Q86_00485 [Flavobacteriales bacterium 33_180_T64]|nr:hypothetical protein A9Q86_00485 [Flavobacteriales bacterium 33_180_T64]
MKKSAVILALALGFSISTLSATNEIPPSNTEEVTVYKYEVSPLCKAVATGNLEVVNNLLKAGADVNKKSNGMMPIHYAAKFNRVEMIKVLITAGSEIHTACDKGFTALRYAEKAKADDAVMFLKRFKRKNI